MNLLLCLTFTLIRTFANFFLEKRKTNRKYIIKKVGRKKFVPKFLFQNIKKMIKGVFLKGKIENYDKYTINFLKKQKTKNFFVGLFFFI